MLRSAMIFGHFASKILTLHHQYIGGGGEDWLRAMTASIGCFPPMIPVNSVSGDSSGVLTTCFGQKWCQTLRFRSKRLYNEILSAFQKIKGKL